jgi:aspartate/methionine/tyrosine aminotransferase
MRLSPFKLERYFARYEFNVDYVLCASDCESFTIAELLALEPEAAQRFHGHWLGYTESSGSPTLREAIAGLYTTVAPDEVLVHSGAEEAVFLFMHAVLEAGDHVIVHSPCYQSLAEVARGMGCAVSPWLVRPENGWALDLADLQRGLRPNTRAIVINTPHNPTGYLMPQADFRAAIQLAEEHGALLFSDEVYRESEYRAEDRLPAACDLSSSAVSLGVTSKSYGLPGLRIGWVATHDAVVRERMAALKDYTTICNSAPSEFLAELALRHRQVLVDRNREIIASNLAVLEGFFGRHPERFAWQRPQAGPVAFPRWLQGDVEDFCHDLVTRAGVLLAPGTAFDDAGNHFRIGFGRRNLPEAVGRLEAYLSEQR